MSLSGAPLTKPIDVRTLLQVGLDADPDAVALSSLRARWTWSELEAASVRLARNYLGLGLKPGDRVASLMPNRCELIIHYLACTKAGLVITPLNYRYMSPEIDHALEVSGASVLLAHDERAGDLAQTRLVSGLPIGVISYDDDGGQGEVSYGGLIKADPQVDLTPLPDQDDPCVIFFTSGSTGKPKGVSHSYRTYGWVVANCIASCQVTNKDVVLAGSSMSHAGGFWFTTMALAAGAKAAVARSFDAHELLPALREMRPTVVFMLPSALFSLIRDHEAVHEDFASIRLCASGGDKVAPKLEEEFTDKTGHPIQEIYGMSEIGLSNMNPMTDLAKVGSLGTIQAGFVLELRDDEGRVLGLGEPGRLWCKFKGVLVGYWDNPKATAETIVDGWVDTGDVMELDADGYFWFRGRKKQIIVHDGSNICPQEVEESLLTHESVEEAGVVGVHDLIHGENVRAYVTIKPDAVMPKHQDLIDCSRRLVGYKAPEEIVVLDSMPLNATGKVDRVKLKALATALHE